MGTTKFVTFFLVLVIWSVKLQAQPIAPFVSFDIDWVTFYTLQPGQPLPQGERYDVMYDQKTYIPTPHLREVVRVLLNYGFQLGFISGGNKQRNELLLRAYKIDGHRTLADVSKILSAHDLFEVPGVSPNALFSNRFKKDLSKYGHPISHIAHIDDLPFFAFNKEQAKSFITLLSTYVFVDGARELELQRVSPKSYRPEYFPPSHEAAAFEQGKLLFVLGLILEAHDSWKKVGGTFQEHVYRRSHNESGEPLWRESPEALQYYQRGITEVEKISHRASFSLIYLKNLLRKQSSSRLSCGNRFTGS
ncbi:MAG: hypothetical protein AB7F59_06375 [Bdellovibrionales bacterium]